MATLRVVLPRLVHLPAMATTMVATLLARRVVLLLAMLRGAVAVARLVGATCQWQLTRAATDVALHLQTMVVQAAAAARVERMGHQRMAVVLLLAAEVGAVPAAAMAGTALATAVVGMVDKLRVMVVVTVVEEEGGLQTMVVGGVGHLTMEVHQVSMAVVVVGVATVVVGMVVIKVVVEEDTGVVVVEVLVAVEADLKDHTIVEKNTPSI